MFCDHISDLDSRMLKPEYFWLIFTASSIRRILFCHKNTDRVPHIGQQKIFREQKSLSRTERAFSNVRGLKQESSFSRQDQIQIVFSHFDQTVRFFFLKTRNFIDERKMWYIIVTYHIIVGNSLQFKSRMVSFHSGVWIVNRNLLHKRINFINLMVLFNNKMTMGFIFTKGFQ